jgi:hypothetical protein
VVFKIGSGFEYFEPRLSRLRLEVFEPTLFINYGQLYWKINFYLDE